jgi:N-acetylmuramoyl-L-alanine amidase
MRNINKIIVHCTATIEGKAFTANDITRWHKQRGFATIGYHWVVLLDGTIQQGRAEMTMGAHCKGHNANSIGICYIGGLDENGKSKDTRTPEQKKALLELLKRLKKDYPNATIHGHREFANKDCPCFDAKNEYKDL